MTIFAMSLSYLWTSGYSDNLIIGGLLPYKDGKFYSYGADLILSGLSVIGANQATERPLFPGFLASLFLITGGNLKLTLAFIIQLMGAGLYVAARQVRNFFGAWAGSIFAVLMYFHIKPWIGYLLSESLGFALGCFAFALILLSASKPKWIDLLPGVSALLVAVSARAGAFIIFPMLAIWAGWARRAEKKFSLKTTGSMFGFFIVGFFLVNSAYSRLLGISPGSSFRNFSYALYGQARGGTGWHSAIVEVGTRDPAAIYRAIWEYFREHPMDLFIGFAKSYRDFFMFGEQGIFPFPRNDFQYWLNFAAWFGTAFLVILGLVWLFRNVRSNVASLLLTGFIGVFLSVPFLPPIDGGTRFYASATSFFFAAPAIGIAWLSRSAPQKIISDLQNEFTIPRFASIMIVALTVFAPPLIFRVGHKPAHTTPVCSAEQKPFVIENQPGSYIDLIKDGSTPCGALPSVCVNDFETNNVERSVDDFYQELSRLVQNEASNARLISGFDLVAERSRYVYISHALFPNGALPDLIAGCAVRIVTKNQTILYVESLIPETR